MSQSPRALWNLIIQAIVYLLVCVLSFLVGSDSKVSACHVGGLALIPGSGRPPGEGTRVGNPLQYSCLANPMDRGAWWATVHGVSPRSGWVPESTT